MPVNPKMRFLGFGLVIFLAMAGCATTHVPTPLAEFPF